MRRKERRLIAAVRLEDTMYDRERRGHCVMCGGEEEGSKHLVVSCEKFEARRGRLVGEGGRSWAEIMKCNQEELVKFLEWIHSMCRVFGGKGLVEKEEEGSDREPCVHSYIVAMCFFSLLHPGPASALADTARGNTR